METLEHAGQSPAVPRWLTALYMIFFLFAFGIGQSVLGFVAVVQFVWLLASGGPNRTLGRFGVSLSRWFADAVRFLTCASDDKPFPWKEWPSAE
jgi:Domain of unknown function (DUF4389)